jgi:hypothetical protein
MLLGKGSNSVAEGRAICKLFSLWSFGLQEKDACLFFAHRIWVRGIFYKLPKTTVDGNRRREGSGATIV